MTEKKPFRKNRSEILYHIINSLLAGGLVFAGSLTTGHITLEGVGAGFLAFIVVALTKFKTYWDGQLKEYSNKNKFVNFI